MRRAFTLLELVLVVFVLAALAMSAVSLAGDVDAQSRLEITKQRRQQIREAILGREATVAGTPVASGFVADMGRLPTSLRELLEPFDDTGAALAAWAPRSENANVGAGWRGPYLPLEWETDSGGVQRPAFRDGWGTRRYTAGTTTLSASDPLNFGWSLTTELEGARVVGFDAVSLGRDGIPGGVAAEDRDLPTYPTPPPPGGNAHLHLVSRDDWLIELEGASAAFSIRNTGPTDIPPDSLRLRLVVGEGGTATSWSAIDSTSTGPAAPLTVGDSTTLSLNLPTPLDAIAAGAWSLEVTRVADGAVVGQPRIVRLLPRSSPVWPNATSWEVTP